jgi:hypothetical protein
MRAIEHLEHQLYAVVHTLGEVHLSHAALADHAQRPVAGDLARVFPVYRGAGLERLERNGAREP